jgi:hypothetical protein
MNPKLKRLSVKHKNNKFLYYSKSFVRLLIPSGIFRSELKRKIRSLNKFDSEYIKQRLNYYNKLESSTNLSEGIKRLKEFRVQKKNKTYFFDTFKYTRFFSSGLRMKYEFGDVTFVPAEPAIVKSRPLVENNSNSVVLNLDKVRHFTFVNDKKEFIEKRDMLVSRNEVGQPHRIKFLEMYINHPMCNIGKINRNGTHPELLKEWLTIDEQLDYKFILCLEGNDVASNLKWVMSSQSLAVMPLPKFETWFMEGTLIPDYHYVRIKDDYSDLEERMKYYISHPDKAYEIIENAHKYIEQFMNRKRENLISLLVLEKYFCMTNQKVISENLKSLFSATEQKQIRV